MIKMKKILLFTTLLILLVGVASAAETVQEDHACTTDTTVASDTGTISQDNRETVNNEENKIMDVKASEKIDERENNTINKKTRDNLKKDNTLEVHNYNELIEAVNTAGSAGVDTSINLLEGSYDNTGTIIWNTANMVLTIERVMDKLSMDSNDRYSAYPVVLPWFLIISPLQMPKVILVEQ